MKKFWEKATKLRLPNKQEENISKQSFTDIHPNEKVIKNLIVEAKRDNNEKCKFIFNYILQQNNQSISKQLIISPKSPSSRKEEGQIDETTKQKLFNYSKFTVKSSPKKSPPKISEQDANNSKLKTYLDSVKDMFKAHMRNVRPNEANTKYFEFVKNSQRVLLFSLFMLIMYLECCKSSWEYRKQQEQ